MISATLAPGPFGWWIAAYFLFAAFAAGVVLRGAGAALVGGETRPLRRACVWSLFAVSLGGGCLIADLASPADFWLTLTNFNTQSWIAWGSRILGLFGILVVVSLAFLAPATGGVATGGVATGEVAAGEKSGKVIPLLLAASAIALGAYPALVLMQATGRPLWDHVLLPALFVTSALHIGFTVGPRLLGVAAAPRLGGVILLLEIGIFAVFAAAQNGMLFPDAVAWVFAAIYIGGAFLIPLFHLRRAAAPGGFASGLLVFAVLTGTLSLRVWLLDAGQSSSSFLS